MQNYAVARATSYALATLTLIATLAIVITIFTRPALAGGTGADGYKCDTHPETPGTGDQNLGLVPDGLLIPCN